VLLDESICIDEDVKYLDSESERIGYPTQKPVGLLKRILRTSSNEGDLVLDPFCGCGTTMYACHEMNRNWIGCDIAILAINLVSKTLQKKYFLNDPKDFALEGIPNSVESASHLAKIDPFQFQNWLVELVGGFPASRKTGDGGIDGRLYFETKDGIKQMVLSVKSGTVAPTHIRDLRGVLEGDKQAEMAGFLTLKPATEKMKEAAVAAGTYEYAGHTFPRIQILSVPQILEEKQEFKTPTKISTKVDPGFSLF
jgi:hypothetical protein